LFDLHLPRFFSNNYLPMPAHPTVPEFRYAPASDTGGYIFGAERPGYGSKDVSRAQLDAWLAFMDSRGIERVCCLLDQEQLEYYKHSPLLETYESKYGSSNVLHALIPDFELSEVSLLVEQILPFLNDSKSYRRNTVVHCAGGKGRTGHVLAAWLVHSEKRSPEEALATVELLFREPLEAIKHGRASYEELKTLLFAAAS